MRRAKQERILDCVAALRKYLIQLDRRESDLDVGALAGGISDQLDSLKKLWPAGVEWIKPETESQETECRILRDTLVRLAEQNERTCESLRKECDQTTSQLRSMRCRRTAVSAYRRAR